MHNVGERLYQRTHLARACDFPNSTQTLLYLVSICNRAANHERRSLIWLTGDAHGNQKKRQAAGVSPHNGSILVVLSKRGADILKE